MTLRRYAKRRRIKYQRAGRKIKKRAVAFSRTDNAQHMARFTAGVGVGLAACYASPLHKVVKTKVRGYRGKG